MRLFTGIAIPPQVIANIEATVDRLRPLAHVKWSPSENLHITTKFIGEWPEKRLEELERALGSIDPPGAISIEVSGFGFFPNASRPRVFFTNVKGGDALQTLAQRTEDALEPLGCAREDRAYSPHLTLARTADADTRALRREIESPRALGREIESIDSPQFGSWHADRFHLYLSKIGGRHSVYTVLASWPLVKETMTA